MAEDLGPYTPQSLADLVAARRSDDDVVLARGDVVDYSGELYVEVSVFRITDDRVSCFLEGMMPSASWGDCATLFVDRFSAECGGCRYVDRKTLVWTEGDVPFRSWHDGELFLHVDGGDTLHLWRETLHRDVIESVERFSSDDWVTRGVRVNRSDGDPLVLVSEDNRLAELDFAYDELDLDTESLWAFSLAKSLAERLNKPFVDGIR